MLYGFSGDPGTGKSLNAIKFIIENDDFFGMPVYYFGIRIMLLDFKVCDSFQGWLYGVYYPENSDNVDLKNRLFKIEKESRLASVEDFPYLAYLYKQHDPVALWLSWFKKVASKRKLSSFAEALAVLNKRECDLTAQDIHNLGLSWNQIQDPTLVHELPAGSVILVDEVQNIWSSRSSSKVLTPDLEFVTVHRHSANHLVYISQNFKDVDPVITRRISHFTYYKFFGGDYLYRYEHNDFFDISSKTDLRRVEPVKIKRDARYYGLYLSAIAHTQKVKLAPAMIKNIKLFSIYILVFIALLYFGFNSSIAQPVRERMFGVDDIESKTSSPVDTRVIVESSASSSNVDTSYLDKFISRFDIMPSSAPFFDDLTANPRVYPKLSCIQYDDKCACFTQQLTAYDVTDFTCKTIAKNGSFDPFMGTKGKRSNPSSNINKVFK
ncbi:zonular occludens toxin domain-containing protein [Vibrio cionasavignyae]|uniref:zonular occludens toxin domain-containing protein n=1 Tax=Vibrio cionasavignyae TaxID=2910252 RepID=UPI003D0B501D